MCVFFGTKVSTPFCGIIFVIAVVPYFPEGIFILATSFYGIRDIVHL